MIYSYNNYPFYRIRDAPIVKNKKGRRVKYYIKDIVTSFDIETARLPNSDNTIMYVWQFAIEGDVVIGRTWEQFLKFVKKLESYSDGYHLACYVHNLSYEFQFLKGIYDFTSEEVFTLAPRKVLTCTMFDFLEFRCSYLLSNMSLKKWCEDSKVKTRKLSGDEFNYNKLRLPNTKLKKYELMYCCNDVLGVVECVRKIMDTTGYNLQTIPLTSTGFVRDDVKKAMRQFSHKYIKNVYPDLETFIFLNKCFRGGDTHANRYHVGTILKNVGSYDLTSAYPFAQMAFNFPMSKFSSFFIPIEKEFRVALKKYACLIEVIFYDIELKNIYEGCPYISLSKCDKINNYVNDNGRILKAEYIKIKLTDIDYKIIEEQYNFNYSIVRLSTARYGTLPPPIKNVIMSYFKDKTLLKGVDDYLYLRSKAKLNAIYGMSATNNLKQDYIYNSEEKKFIFNPDYNVDEKIVNDKKSAFILYAWGVWTTAHVRNLLNEGRKAVGVEHFVYCDTDSIKFIGDKDEQFKKINDYIIQKAKESGAYIKINDHVEYMGVYDKEKTYKRFITYGAKKYAYEYDGDDSPHITIAGVNKVLGGQELGKLENLKPGFTFKIAGGLEATYNDNVNVFETLHGQNLHITDNLTLTQGDYTLGITDEFEELLNIISDLHYKGEIKTNE